MYPQVFSGRAPERMLQRGPRVRSTRVAAALLAMMMVSAGCGARLTKAQLAKAAAGGGQQVSSGGSATGTDTGTGRWGDGVMGEV